VYSHCLFCSRDLGRNEALETFPVGRRLAYDAAKGRLWVVCRVCERWNLTPLEERWEAIEQAERRFRGTRLRAATDQVGLARLADGTDLVRIGRPLFPEFAAWRYGDQFGRRRRRQLAIGAGGAAAFVGLLVAGPMLGFFSFSAVMNLHQAVKAVGWARRARRSIVVADPRSAPATDPGRGDDAAGHAVVGTGRILASLAQAERARLAPDADGFALVLPARERRWYDVWTRHGVAGPPPEARLSGRAALVAASRLLPPVNGGGGGPLEVRDAVQVLAAAGGAEALFAQVAGDGRRYWDGRGWRQQSAAYGPTLGALPPHTRLALEMAAHEEQERRALDGELAALERAWRDADVIAAIADDLLVPESVEREFARMRRASPRGAGEAPDASARPGAPRTALRRPPAPRILRPAPPAPRISLDSMPTYEFRCANGHAFDQFHKISDAPQTAACPTCGADGVRAISAGQGWCSRGADST
jgi:putative FmdB family regulatory protein